MIRSRERRRPVSAEIRRRVLVEAGHKCAIPTCRNIEVDIHHIVQWAKCQSNEYNNLIALCPNCHRRAHAGKIDRKSLRLYKVNLRFAHDKYSQLEIDVLFELSKMPPDTGMPWVQYMLIHLKRLIDSGFISVHELSVGSFVGTIKTTPDMIAITNKGREFIDELGLHKL